METATMRTDCLTGEGYARGMRQEPELLMDLIEHGRRRPNRRVFVYGIPGFASKRLNPRFRMSRSAKAIALEEAGGKVFRSSGDPTVDLIEGEESPGIDFRRSELEWAAMFGAVEPHKFPARGFARGDFGDFLALGLDAEFLREFARRGVIVSLPGMDVPRGARIPAQWVHIFPLRAALEEKFAAPIEDEQMHGAVAQFLAMHFVARCLAGDAIVFIHDIENLSVRVLRLIRRVVSARGEIRQVDPLAEAELFGSHGFWYAELLAKTGPIRDLAAKVIAQQLAALGETHLYDAGKSGSIARRQFRGIAW
jgi:hypothetical protein